MHMDVQGTIPMDEGSNEQAIGDGQGSEELSSIVQRPLQELAECLCCSLCTRILRDAVTAPECMHRCLGFP